MFRIALICTPLAGILAGFIYSATGILKGMPHNPRETITAIILFVLLGSFFAAPTTLIGLPLIAYNLPKNDRRLSLKLALSGFALGWITMMGWCAFWGLYRLHGLDRIVALSAVCIVGALCGAITGWLMAWYGRERDANELGT
jgi:hypothetical protein